MTHDQFNVVYTYVWIRTKIAWSLRLIPCRHQIMLILPFRCKRKGAAAGFKIIRTRLALYFASSWPKKKKKKRTVTFSLRYFCGINQKSSAYLNFDSPGSSTCFFCSAISLPGCTVFRSCMTIWFYNKSLL